MIQTDGLLTVAEAAKRLNRSTEQVRRYLREGKLKGQRVGNQWFIEEGALPQDEKEFRPLIPKELMDEIDRSREATFRRNGIVFDVVAELRADRDSH
jgi:excisionase family DNA binding protein